MSQYGRYADLHKGAKVSAPPALGLTGFGVHPSLTKGVGGSIKGLFDGSPRLAPPVRARKSVYGAASPTP